MPRPLYDRSSTKLPKLKPNIEGVTSIAPNPAVMKPTHPAHPANVDIGNPNGFGALGMPTGKAMRPQSSKAPAAPKMPKPPKMGPTKTKMPKGM